MVTDAVRTDGTTVLLSSHIVTDVEQACDRLIVLGVGRVLLHETVAAALGRHGISTGTRAGAVATFRGPDGAPISLVAGAGERPATLEELVLGYLASGRGAGEVAA